MIESFDINDPSLKWQRSGIWNRLQELEKFMEIAESGLEDSLVSFNSWLDKKASNIPESEKSDFYENYSEEHWSFSKSFPHLLRYSWFVACYSFLENELISLCDTCYKNLKLNKKPPSSGIFKAKDYLTDAAGIQFPVKSQWWKEICVYNKLRNSIVHDNGLVEEKKGSKEIKEFTSKYSSVVSLSDNGQIQFTKEICPMTIRTLRFFFRELLEQESG